MRVIRQADGTLQVIATQRYFFAQLGGSGSVDIVPGLAWSYTPPLPCRTASRKPTATRSGWRSGTRSATASPTNKRE